MSVTGARCGCRASGQDAPGTHPPTPLQVLEERHLSRSRSAGGDELSLPSTSSSCGGGGASGGSDSVGGLDAEVRPCSKLSRCRSRWCRQASSGVVVPVTCFLPLSFKQTL